MTGDDELAIKAASGDAQAFQLLLEGHYDRIYRLAFRFFGNQADAEDITQDVCLALPKKIKIICRSRPFFYLDLPSCNKRVSRPAA